MAAVDLRTTVLDALRLIASRELQLAFEKDYPFIDTPVELICMWFDDPMYMPEWSLFKEAFSPLEQEKLAAFNKFYLDRVTLIPSSLAPMQDSSVWQEIMFAASQTLLSLETAQ